MQGQTASYVITTLVVPPGSSALTTLATVKDELSIAAPDVSNDGSLTRWIAECSDGIAGYCHRIFGLATWQDEFRPQRGVRGEGVRAALNPLQLTRWPLVEGVINFSGNSHSNRLIDGIATTAGLSVGMPVFGSVISTGTTITQLSASSIYLSSNATATTPAVALSAGISVAETIAGTTTQLVGGTDFQVDMGTRLPGDEGTSGLYRLNLQGNPRTWPAAKVAVTYQAGYVLPSSLDTTLTPNLPTDLESACIRLVVGKFHARKRDPLLVQKTQPQLGDQRWWVGSAPGQRGPYPNEIVDVLDRYRVPVTA